WRAFVATVVELEGQRALADEKDLVVGHLPVDGDVLEIFDAATHVPADRSIDDACYRCRARRSDRRRQSHLASLEHARTGAHGAAPLRSMFAFDGVTPEGARPASQHVSGPGLRLRCSSRSRRRTALRTRWAPTNRNGSRGKPRVTGRTSTLSRHWSSRLSSSDVMICPPR